MAGTQNRNEDVFAKYNAMGTEELQQILREDASKPEGQEETSTEALFYIMEVLAQRRRARNEGKTPEEALEAFHKYYEEDEESSKTEREPVVRKKNSTAPNWIKRLVAAAAIIILIFSGSITAKAFGFDLWEIIVKWTQETFHFGTPYGETTNDAPEKDSSEVFLGLQSALDDYDITAKLVPTWMPEGYTEMSVKVQDTPKQRQFAAMYQLEENTIMVRIADYLEGEPVQIEQSDSLLEVYTIGDVDYYIFDNLGQLRVAWVSGRFECCIMGSLSVEELKEMVESIGKD